MQKLAALIPHQMANVFRRRHTIIRQLHNKGHGFALQHEFLQQERHKNSHDNTQNVEQRYHQARLLREKRLAQEHVDGQLCRTAHERRKDNGQLAVALRGKRARCHNAGHAAAETNEHGNNAAARKSQLTQRFVHNERHARQIAAIFKHGQEEEQHGNDGQKR